VDPTRTAEAHDPALGTGAAAGRRRDGTEDAEDEKGAATEQPQPQPQAQPQQQPQLQKETEAARLLAAERWAEQQRAAREALEREEEERQRRQRQVSHASHRPTPCYGLG
jgi:hypothetical protein